MAKATRPKVVTVRPGNGQRITVETDPARDEAFRQITSKLFRARSALNHELLTALRGLLDALEEGRAWSGDPRYIAAQRAVAAAEGVAS